MGREKQRSHRLRMAGDPWTGTLSVCQVERGGIGYRKDHSVYNSLLDKNASKIVVDSEYHHILVDKNIKKKDTKFRKASPAIHRASYNRTSYSDTPYVNRNMIQHTPVLAYIVK